MLSARDRRLRLATFGNATNTRDGSEGPKFSIPNGADGQQGYKQEVSNYRHQCRNKPGVVVDDAIEGHLGETRFVSETSESANRGSSLYKVQNSNSNGNESKKKSQIGDSDCLNGIESYPMGCESSTSGYTNGNSDQAQASIDDYKYTSNINNQQQPKVMSQLLVESTNNATNNSKTVISTTTVTPNMMASCDIDQRQNQTARFKLVPGFRSNESQSRSASSSGNLELYSSLSSANLTKLNAKERDNMTPTVLKRLSSSSITSSQQNLDRLEGDECALDYHHQQGKEFKSSTSINDLTSQGSLKINNKGDKSHHKNETRVNQGARSIGSITMTPIPGLVKLQAAQRQIRHNETTTKLLIAVMLVFLICEFPAGILAALCAILGQEFFENVYQPTGILTDLLALINSSVNFILYCFMSTQFRVTFYQVVLHCPAPNAAQNNQTILMKSKNHSSNNTNTKNDSSSRRAPNRNNY